MDKKKMDKIGKDFKEKMATQMAELVKKKAIQREKAMKAEGWIIEVISDTKDSKCATGTGRDAHTHGIEEKFGHMDLQCVLPINADLVGDIFHRIVKMIKEGTKFESGKCYGDIVNNKYKIRFLTAMEGDREVLRIIIPDKNGKLHKELMEEKFRVQFNGIN